MNETQRDTTEIERRFLVCGREWSELGRADCVHQGYLNTDRDRTVRVRIKRNKGFFTVKGRTVSNEKPEIETEIPTHQARAILDHPAGLCTGYPIEKIRRTAHIGNLIWEVDEFAGENQGLVIAEVEYDGLASGTEEWNRKVDKERPSWTGDEVSGDPKYFNSRLTDRPFSRWTEDEQAPMLRHASGCDRTNRELED